MNSDRKPSPELEEAISPLRRDLTPAIVPRLRASAVIELDAGLRQRDLPFGRQLAVGFVDEKRRTLAYFVAPKADWPLPGTKHHGGVAAVPALGLGGGLSPRCVAEEVLAHTKGLRLYSTCTENANRWFAELLKAAGFSERRVTIRRLEQAFCLSEVDYWDYQMAWEAVSRYQYHSSSAAGSAECSAELLRIIADSVEAHGPPRPTGSAAALVHPLELRRHQDAASAPPRSQRCHGKA
jgi:hypothetical protein